uniref:Uncharacterized protein n=1 Tax=Oryza brachyantha TaxID=4533 RepID=J3LHT8_ORYBR
MNGRVAVEQRTLQAAPAVHGVAELHVVLAERAQAVELREHHVGEVRPVLSPELAAADGYLGEAARFVDGPILDGRVEQVGERAVLERAGDVVREAHRRPRRDDLQQHDAEGVDVRLDAEQPRLLVLRVDVAEGPRRRRHVALRDAVGDGRRHEAGEADVADLADVVAVEEDVGRLQVAVDQRLGLGLVEEEQADLADVVAVEKDVARLEVAVDERLGLGLVQEQQGLPLSMYS